MLSKIFRERRAPRSPGGSEDSKEEEAQTENLSESMPIASVQAGLSSTDVAHGQMGAAGSASPQESHTEKAQRAGGFVSNVLSMDKESSGSTKENDAVEPGFGPADEHIADNPTAQQVLDSHAGREKGTRIIWDQQRRAEVFRLAKKELVEEMAAKNFSMTWAPFKTLVIQVNNLPAFESKRSVTAKQLANLLRQRKAEMDKGQQTALAWIQFVKHYADKLKDRPGNIFERCQAVIDAAGHETV